jgi:GT2 family glycosyltransferase/glycosyltransferase involved in cell wall biosynthesis/polysaccharide pyruvyl transferase WcaK-like protein
MKIAHFGTFDVENYGDLLFPLLIERRLGRSEVEFVHVSPIGGAPPVKDCKPVIGFEEALGQCESWDAIVLGGGALGHGDSAGEVKKYRRPEIHTIAYPGLWLLPALISDLRGIPLVWNAPGVPGDFSEERKRRLMQWACWQANYLSVRDTASAQVLAQSMVEAMVVPDTAVEVSALWTNEELRSEMERLKQRKGWPRDRYLALHLNERYAHPDLAGVAESIKQICASQGAAALLIAIGDCHGDTEFANRLSRHLQGYPASIFTPDSLRSVAAAIQFSEGYVGSSLHGAVTAYAFDRPLLVVAPESRAKFAGFLRQVAASECQVPTWAAAAAILGNSPSGRWKSLIAPGQRQAISQALDQHWRQISVALTSRRPIDPHAGPRVLGTLSSMPPEWFPLIRIIQQSPLFARLFEKYKDAWEPVTRNLQDSAFVAAANYRRLELRHQKLMLELNSLQTKLSGLSREKEKLREDRYELLDTIAKTKNAQQDQRRAFDEKSDALLATIHKRDGRIEALEEQRIRLEEKLRAREAGMQEQAAHLKELRERLQHSEAGARESGLRLEELAQSERSLTAFLNTASKDLARLSKWSDRLLADFQRVLRSNRWRFGCWLSLKRADAQSKEAQRLKQLIAKRPQHTAIPNEILLARPSLSPGQTPISSGVSRKPVPLQKPAEVAGIAPPIRRPSPPKKDLHCDGQLISIVIPVFNAFDDLVRCLESLHRNSRPEHLVIAVDDASPDERIWPLLQQWEARYSNFRAVRNDSNIGYTATVNRGCQLAGPGDIVLLNSDTILPPRWLEQMAACAYSRPRVATVTALSNAAGAFSVPQKNVINSLPPKWSIEQMATFVGRTSQRIRPAIPTGNGFCLYVTNAARQKVGSFDAKSFPQGYGEENDFCLRAAAAGFVNLIDDATYVFHRRSASFGANKERILRESRAVLDRLHPSYTQQVREWSQADELDPVREEMDRHLQRIEVEGLENVLPADPRPCLLYVLHEGTGGTRFTSRDLSDAMVGSYRTLVLLTALDHWTLCEYFGEELIPVRRYAFPELWRVDRSLPSERLTVLREICADYDTALAHVRHLLGSGPELIATLRELQIPIVFSFHDFYTICPTIQLLDETRTYCAGRCTAGAGDCPLPANWFRPPLPWLKHRYVHEHKRRMAEELPFCDAFVTTSETSRHLISEHFPTLDNKPFVVIEHGRNLTRLELARPPVAGQPLRVIFFGDLTPAKGLKLILQLLELNRAAGNPIELHAIGKKPANLDTAQLGAVYHGTYERDELPERVRGIAPAVSLVPSPWPETYCHVLTESWAMGLPVLASDIGTLRERISQNGGGWLLPVDDAPRWLEKVLHLIGDTAGYAAALAEVRKIKIPDVAWMAGHYDALYKSLLLKRREPKDLESL